MCKGTMNIIHSIRKDSFWGTQIVFEVPLASNTNVYMRIDHRGALEHERSVVIVDALRFLALWKLEPYNFNSELSRGNPDTWKSDRKFSHAEQGFSKGVTDPVPLANVVCNPHIEHDAMYEKKYIFVKKLVGYKEREFDYVDFNNGITRTIWLLTHGAPYFPVECHNTDGTERLYQNCGVQGSEIYTVHQLINT